MNVDSRSYRPCVVGLFIDPTTKKLLIALRSHLKEREAWQFPQGGVEAGESYQEALYREMFEELGCRDFDIIHEYPDLFYYDFPKDLNIALAKKYKGQMQKWFLCRFHQNKHPDLDKATDKEFSELRWVPAQEALSAAISWKKQVYHNALTYFGLLL